jgi:hypothetical protein
MWYLYHLLVAAQNGMNWSWSERSKAVPSSFLGSSDQATSSSSKVSWYKKTKLLIENSSIVVKFHLAEQQQRAADLGPLGLTRTPLRIPACCKADSSHSNDLESFVLLWVIVGSNKIDSEVRSQTLTARPNAKGPRFLTILHNACNENKRTASKFLLCSGAITSTVHNRALASELDSRLEGPHHYCETLIFPLDRRVGGIYSPPVPHNPF